MHNSVNEKLSYSGFRNSVKYNVLSAVKVIIYLKIVIRLIEDSSNKHFLTAFLNVNNSSLMDTIFG